MKDLWEMLIAHFVIIVIGGTLFCIWILLMTRDWRASQKERYEKLRQEKFQAAGKATRRR